MKVCAKCGQEFHQTIKVGGRIRVLSRRKHCTKCVPFRHGDPEPMARRETYTRCVLCGKDTSAARSKRLCAACRTKVRRYKNKLRAIKLMGGKCTRCGWSEHNAGFQFHHPNKDKEFNVGRHINKSWEVLKKELKKCELLCANCHQLEHSDIRNPKLLLEVERLSKGS